MCLFARKEKKRRRLSYKSVHKVHTQRTPLSTHMTIHHWKRRKGPHPEKSEHATRLDHYAEYFPYPHLAHPAALPLAPSSLPRSLPLSLVPPLQSFLYLYFLFVTYPHCFFACYCSTVLCFNSLPCTTTPITTTTTKEREGDAGEADRRSKGRCDVR